METRTKMKAVIYTKYGEPEVLQLAEIEKPQPKDNELLVKVKASSVTSGTIWMRKGKFPGSFFFTLMIRLIFGITKPKRKVLGFEFSGIVEQVGKNVTQFKIGDAVYGTTTGLKNGAYADYVCVPEKWKMGVVMHKPETLSFETAAVLPIGAMTALCILKKANLSKGKTILIYGASGSVGSYAVQIANYYEAKVTGVCSTKNLELVKSIGANVVLDYTKNDFNSHQDKYAIIFDAVGKLNKKQWKNRLNSKGVYCSVKTITDERIEYLNEIHQMWETGLLKPIIDRSYTIDEIVDAHQYVDLGHKVGNVCIVHN